MAKIKFGSLLTDMKGKLGGTVYSRNRYGAYSRNLVIPINPQTNSQSGVRSRMAGNSQAWRGLTPGQRQAWIDQSPNFPYINNFGDQIILQGNSLYNALNNNLINVGESAISSPPVPSTVPTITSAVLTMAAGLATATLAYTPTPVPADSAVIIFATFGMSPGMTFAKNRFRQITVLAAAAASPADIAAAYVSKFGNIPLAGQKVFIKLIVVNSVSGQASAPFITSSIVGA